MQVLRAHLPRVFCLTLLAIGATSFVPTSGDEPRGEEAEEAEAEADEAAAAAEAEAEAEAETEAESDTVGV